MSAPTTVDGAAPFQSLVDDYEAWRSDFVSNLGILDRLAGGMDRIALLDKDRDDAIAAQAAGDETKARSLILAALNQTGMAIVGGGQNTVAETNIATMPTVADEAKTVASGYLDKLGFPAAAQSAVKTAGTILGVAVGGWLVWKLVSRKGKGA